MKILGIDPGFGRMGYAIVETEGRKQKLIKAGCIETSPKDKHEKRLLAVGKELEKIILKNKPQVIAVEKIFFAKNQKTALKVAEAKGVVLYLAGLYKLPVFEFSPLEIKTSLCGYGRADKPQMRKMLKAVLGLESLPNLDDSIDAIAIALICFPRVYPQPR